MEIKIIRAMLIKRTEWIDGKMFNAILIFTGKIMCTARVTTVKNGTNMKVIYIYTSTVKGSVLL